ncbi:restriction endonuclease (plasmid) [Vibrio campbellii]|uniref:restriction endonuclease n=1 Tax=Vibrio campbellii TaxID=680 RepID=UPI000A3004F4|nr:restriction endonuclease [Vibrio campbellii]ARR48135.1 restriction endonuclease [Vibrio campbellii]
MNNNGREYEAFVASLQQALLDSEEWMALKNIVIERNKKIVDRCGVEREFDLYWEYELAGICYKTVIECKDYASSISIDKIDSFVGKIQDVPGVKPIFATRTGYQSGAKIKAEKYNIELLIVRESDDSDWTLADGTPCIREVSLKVISIPPARIMEFNPHMDNEWIKANTDLKQGNTELNLITDITFIDDVSRGDKYSLQTLEQRLGRGTDDDFGQRSISLDFERAYLITEQYKLKLSSVDITYWMPKPIYHEMHIDASRELVGVIEYLNKKSKTVVFENRIVENW